MAIKLLITARDVAAALHLIQVANAARADKRFQVQIAAQQPAARHFLDAGFEVQLIEPLSTRSAQTAEAVELRSVARRLLSAAAPDAVLAGLSTPFDAGLDEAVLLESRVPTVLFQDFWGEQNLLLGKGADLVLAVDDEAVLLNKKRYGIDSCKVGSARHAAYRALDIAGIRQRARAELGIAANECLIGFFGQALHQLPGYARTVQHFVNALASLPTAVRLLVRPHPRENAEQRKATEALFIKSGLNLAPPLEGPVENALIACDVACSLFSSCTYDAAYLNRFSAAPVAVPLSMLFDQEIVTYCEQHVNFETFPYHRSGAVLAVHDPLQLASVLAQSMQASTHQLVWRNAHAHLADPAAAPQLALDKIADFLDRPRN